MPGSRFASLAFLCCTLIAGLLLECTARAESSVGAGELNRLFELHPAHRPPQGDPASLDRFESRRTLIIGSDKRSVSIQIPGFQHFGCGQCHEGEILANTIADSLTQTISKLEALIPEVNPLPLRQFIIQAYTDDLLHPGQLAHTTFDTVRFAAGALVIDRHGYDHQTLLHEMLHLSQPFLGHVNELEAYGLNIRHNPRFLLLNYPYFQNVTQAYFVPDFPSILKAWYASGTDSRFSLPREVQWTLQPFDEDQLAALQEAIESMKPVLKEASRLYRKHPIKTAYLSEQTGVRSLMLDIAAVKLLGLPAQELSPEDRKKGKTAYTNQMSRLDNTRLGYVIDRMQEASMAMKYTSGPKDENLRLALYFHYIKDRFFDEAGDVVLPIEDEDDFSNFIQRKIKDLETMAGWPGFTEVERQGALRMVEELKKNPAVSK